MVRISISSKDDLSQFHELIKNQRPIIRDDIEHNSYALYGPGDPGILIKLQRWTKEHPQIEVDISIFQLSNFGSAYLLTGITQQNYKNGQICLYKTMSDLNMKQRELYMRFALQ